MATLATEQWLAGAANESSVLTTELNAIADAAYSAKGTALDNATNKDRFAIAELAITFGTNPTAGGVIDVYAFPSLDGVAYADGSASVVPSPIHKVGEFVVRAATTAQLLHTDVFELRGPHKHKFLLRNRAGFAFPATGTTMKVTTFNRQVTA